MEIREVTGEREHEEGKKKTLEREKIPSNNPALPPSDARRVHARILSRIVQQLKHNSEAYEPWRIARQTDVKVWVMAGSVADLFRYFTDSASLLATASAFLVHLLSRACYPFRVWVPRLQKRDYRRFTVQARASRWKRVAPLEERVYLKRAEAV